MLTYSGWTIKWCPILWLSIIMFVVSAASCNENNQAGTHHVTRPRATADECLKIIARSLPSAANRWPWPKQTTNTGKPRWISYEFVDDNCLVELFLSYGSDTDDVGPNHPHHHHDHEHQHYKTNEQIDFLALIAKLENLIRENLAQAQKNLDKRLKELNNGAGTSQLRRQLELRTSKRDLETRSSLLNKMLEDNKLEIMDMEITIKQKMEACLLSSVTLGASRNNEISSLSSSRQPDKIGQPIARQSGGGVVSGVGGAKGASDGPGASLADSAMAAAVDASDSCRRQLEQDGTLAKARKLWQKLRTQISVQQLPETR